MAVNVDLYDTCVADADNELNSNEAPVTEPPDADALGLIASAPTMTTTAAAIAPASLVSPPRANLW